MAGWTDFGIQDRSNATPVSAAYVESFGQHIYDLAIADAVGGGGLANGYVGLPANLSDAPIVYPEQFDPNAGAGGDDTDALRSCLLALVPGGGTIRLRDNATYLVNGNGVAPDRTQDGNAFLAIPASLDATNFPYLAFIGNGNTKIRTTRNDGTYATTGGGPNLAGVTYNQGFGPPSILGGPTEERKGNPSGGGNALLRITVIIDGVDFEVASVNPTYCAVDLVKIGRAAVQHSHISSSVVQTTTPGPSNAYAFGLRMPGALKLGMSQMNEVLVTGFYYAYVLTSSHNTMLHTNCKHCHVGIGVGDQPNLDPHVTRLLNVQILWCRFSIAGYGYGYVVAGPPPKTVGLQTVQDSFNMMGGLSLEDSNSTGTPSYGEAWMDTQGHFWDENNKLAGDIMVHRVLGGDVTPNTEPLKLYSGTSTPAVNRDIQGGRMLRCRNVLPANVTWDIDVRGTEMRIPGTWVDRIVGLSGTGTITDIDPGFAGQVVVLKAQNGTVGLANGPTMLMSGDWAPTLYDMITLRCDGTNWYESGRSGNNV